MSGRVFLTLRRAALTFTWGRVPKTWELSFIDRMRKLMKLGLTFDEVLYSTLPQFFGEDPSRVLRFWVGRSARRDPERFARAMSKMFGASARSVLGNVESLADEESLLEETAPEEPPIQSLLEALRKIDAATPAAMKERPLERLLHRLIRALTPKLQSPESGGWVWGFFRV